MSDVLESLNGLIIPLAGKPLLLPNVAVAELVAYRLSQSASSGPEWFLGWTLWRDQQVPMVDLDNLLAEGAEPAAGAEPRTLILNALDGVTNLRFIGVRVWGIPRARRLTREEVEKVGEGSRYVLQRVQVAEEAGELLIPDLSAVEQALDQSGLLRRAG
ncbi:chemotaxis protein CheW [Pseudomonas sp. 5Ae-yellow]|jgi:chemosensory pili system protein ChpC|uniref:chemotaxis protein CheW n=1 Tax=Pseudomonas sp. 5Ae-yellow TaxID=2759848 RepID=UPI0015F36B2F|nr:chemotaxis protein CheW [Pseudomonas sp. 5Ae-yellow]MBA6419093.1 chemotaxis protein CheW [Pseudomonas sp. 5Ae-yellow]|tara:strand:- start:1738 stop:2214 length:477 start_codon:yes stop_codon:yes gene_type:complete